MEFAQQISQELNLSLTQVKNTLELLAENTIPFIARYRKEATQNLDEVQIESIHDRFQYLKELEERRAVILKSIEDQGKLTPELEKTIRAAETKQKLEDLYLPYKPKRRTRAIIAKEKGLEPLAHALLAPQSTQADLEAWLNQFNAERPEPMTFEEAISGARDIVAEWISEDAETREGLRELTWKAGLWSSKVKPEFVEKPSKFEMYYDFEESISQIPAHRYLALRRGEKESVLTIAVALDEDRAISQLSSKWLEGISTEMRPYVEFAIQDSYNRLLASSIETDIRLEMKTRADETSIELFSKNLRELLLQPPGGPRIVLGIDPGFRTGSKWVVIDATGQFLEHGVIYPVPPQNRVEESQKVLTTLIEKHQVDVIVVGNGTASREVSQFVRGFLKTLDRQVEHLVVNESGASVYSASKVARDEFPDLDTTVRGGISIARRYQDPLAELVKVDPKSIGVGQYQHDVNQTRLKQSLDRTVESCVNFVGVDVNTASAALLGYVAGLNSRVAQRIVEFRNENGPFRSREELKGVSGLGQKSFEQAAGFLRIPDASNPLDRSAVHPENYSIVKRMSEDHKVSVEEMVGNESIIQKLKLDQYASDQVGMFTLKDIVEELRKPGRDPRQEHSSVQFDENIQEISDLKVGVQLNGVVTNITHFGAFVDIGVHHDGLVHISEMSDKFIRDPLEVCTVGQKVMVFVKEVDVDRQRIALSMRSQEKQKEQKKTSGKSSSTSANPVAKAPRKAAGKMKRVKDVPAKSRTFDNDLEALMNKFNR